MTRNKSLQSGITLIEVVVSIFLFGIALGALLFLMTTTLTNADELRRNTVASGLAQEGIEIVRNIRDKNRIEGDDFYVGLPNGTYEVDWNSNTLTPSTGREIYKSANGIFSYVSTGEPTGFRRVMTISDGSGNYEKRISVLMTWPSNDGNTRSLGAESHLYDWY